MYSNLNLRIISAIVSLGVIFFSQGPLLAQTNVTLPAFPEIGSGTFVTPSQTIDEGADFASQVLGNAWDMNERRDIGWEEKFREETISVGAGVWQAEVVAASGSAAIYPLYPGTRGSVNAQVPQADRTLPRLGINNRIDTGKYSILAFKMSHTFRSQIKISWEDTPNSTTGSYLPSGNKYCIINDTADSEEERIYVVDLKNLGGPGVCSGGFSGAWQGDKNTGPFALKIEPSTAATTGTVKFDWIRLVQPESPSTIAWNLAAASSHTAASKICLDSDVNDSLFEQRATLYPLPFPAPNGTYVFNASILPPGQYVVLVSAITSGPSPTFQVTETNATLSVNAQPTVFFNSPSQLSGQSFADLQRGDPWDMSSATDIANYTATDSNFSAPNLVQDTTSSEFPQSVFSAIANTGVAPVSPGSVISNNPHVELSLQSSTGPLLTIDPNRYRYLAYRMKSTVGPENLGIADRVLTAGWVSNVVYASTSLSRGYGRTLDNPVYEGFNTYVIDLWDRKQTTNSPWQNFAAIKSLRIDPLRTAATALKEFQIDWVKLLEEPSAKENKLDISMTVENVIGLHTATLYYHKQKDFNLLSSGVIATLSGNSSLHKFNIDYQWNTSAVPAGRYYITAVISESPSLRSVTRTSDVQVRIGPVSRTSTRTISDYDGDGRSDETVFRPSSGNFFEHRSDTDKVSIKWVSGAYTPVQGDFDGDAKTDIALIFNHVGYIGWYVHHSGDNTVEARTWGIANTDTPVVADYNGDGRDQIAVFRAGTWFIIDEVGGVKVVFWGQAGDKPVPCDYDGDGTSDIAVWRPIDTTTGVHGNWYIINSGFQSQVSAFDVSVIPFGLNGDIPVAADWFGDGKCDLGVYRPSEGKWYLQDIMSSGGFEAVAFGTAGNNFQLPLPGDYDGDGKLDITIFDPVNSSIWSHKFRSTSTTQSLQWGLPNDIVPLPVRQPISSN